MADLAAKSATDSVAEPAPAARRLVLVVEDEAIIAMDLAFTLEEAGFEVMDPAGTVEVALDLLATARPDAAVLDLILAGERSAHVALALRRLGVPFVVQSAYDPVVISGEEALNRAPRLDKLSPPGRLVALLRHLLEGGGAASRAEDGAEGETADRVGGGVAGSGIDAQPKG